MSFISFHKQILLTFENSIRDNDDRKETTGAAWAWYQDIIEQFRSLGPRVTTAGWVPTIEPELRQVKDIEIFTIHRKITKHCILN